MSTSPWSRRLWGLVWPALAFDGVEVEAAPFACALPFIEAHYASIFGADAHGRFLADPLTPAKRRFAEEMDVLVLREVGRIVGVLMGHPLDWTTYYMRSLALLPEAQERRLGSRVMEATHAPLRAAGVQRIETECSPANTRSLRMLHRQGYVVTSTSASERWGLVLRLTRFLDERAADAFSRQFSPTPFHPLAAREV